MVSYLVTHQLSKVYWENQVLLTTGNHFYLVSNGISDCHQRVFFLVTQPFQVHKESLVKSGTPVNVFCKMFCWSCLAFHAFTGYSCHV